MFIRNKYIKNQVFVAFLIFLLLHVVLSLGVFAEQSNITNLYGDGAAKNSYQESNDKSVNLRNIQALHPHLQKVFERHPELLDFIMVTPPEELRDKLITEDVPGDIHPEILRQLAHNPELIDIKVRVSTQQEDRKSVV